VAKPTDWTDGMIIAQVPDFNADRDLPLELSVSVVDELGNENSVKAAKFFTVNSAISLSPVSGVPGTTVTITGRGTGSSLPATQGKDTVIFADDTTSVPGTIVNWDKSGITVRTPDLVTERESRDSKQLIAAMKKDIADVKARPKPAENDKQEIRTEKQQIKAARTEDDTLTVRVADANGSPLENLPKLTFTETPPQWSDKDETPFDIRFVGGYEQGYQSAQASASDAFLAVYGRALSGDRVGPFYEIRLQTAPQASGTNGVVSVLTNPSGSITSQNLQSVGTAVDMSLGLEVQFWNRHGQNSLGFIAGGGYVTPLQTNSVSASYTMPAFGTVECTELQSRLSSVLSSSTVYAGVKATTSTTTPATTYCFTNGTTSTPANITTLEYAAPGQPNFFPKYFAGLRTVTRFPGATGLKRCDENNPCERGYADFMLGQDASVTGGTFRHLVATVDSIYPLPMPPVNFLYLFGSVSERFHRLPSSQSPLVLQLPASSGQNSPPPAPNPAVLVLPLTQPDRDFYRIGIGVSLNQIFTALKPKSATP
jgi:hypothetical protein